MQSRSNITDLWPGLRMAVFLVLVCGVVPATRTTVRAADENSGDLAVSSTVSADYIRARLPDGSFQPEAYAFGRGGCDGGWLSDPTIDRVHFLDVARTIAAPLASQNYLPAKDPNQTTLLIMVYWGMTNGVADAPRGGSRSELASFLDSQGNNTLLDTQNARMLGYESVRSESSKRRGTALAFRSLDLVDELQHNRYFVVLMAYDFQLLWKQKKHKLLWTTRFSIPERRNAFDYSLPAMALDASPYFGRSSNGLTHKPLPEGKVEIGELKALGVVR
jgi:hypothetical protein